MKLFARRRWPLIEGQVIDKRHIKKFLARFDSSSYLVSVDEYMVEYSGPDGTPRRVTIKAQSARLPVQGVHIGHKVPLHVNRRGTKAVFGIFEPRVSWREQRRRDKERRERDKARFDEKLKQP